jgi:hypothetical protein
MHVIFSVSAFKNSTQRRRGGSDDQQHNHKVMNRLPLTHNENWYHQRKAKVNRPHRHSPVKLKIPAIKIYTRSGLTVQLIDPHRRLSDHRLMVLCTLAIGRTYSRVDIGVRKT